MLRNTEQWTTTYDLQQVDEDNYVPPTASKGFKQRIDIPSITIGPVTISGYINTDTLKVGISLPVFGINFANLYGNVKDGIVAKLDLEALTGSATFFLDGKDVKVHVKGKVIFDGSWNETATLFALPD